ncbi:MAG: Ig-like domain-containing protein [Verrucomicrobiota bacterium]
MSSLLALWFGGGMGFATPTIWNGPVITYTQPAPDPTQAANRDQLTPNVSITRGVSAGIFNGVTETVYTHLVSPADTEWAIGNLADYATLTYASWEATGGGRPVLNLPNQPLVVHLISEDIYLSVKFTALGGGVAGGGNGFTYERSTPAAGNLPPSVAITAPTNTQAFTAPVNITIVANASDPDGSVTNVLFFDGAVLLGATNNTPYTITTALAIGSHALSAVATDNQGLSSTSGVVNVTVSVGNVPPSVSITNPLNNAVFGNTEAVSIQTTASDSDGSVTNVRVFNGTVLLRTFTAAPFNFTTTSIAGSFVLGTNTLTAVATDNLGLATTSAPVRVVIARYLPAITNGMVGVFLQPIATGMSAPDYAISPPGDTNRLFVVEQNGLLRIIQNGVLLPGSALDISGLISTSLVATNANDERGFLGLAFHPGFTNSASPGYRTLYTFNSQLLGSGPTYVAPNGATQGYKTAVNEWKISTTNANVVDPNSRREVISFGKNANNHNGGTDCFRAGWLPVSRFGRWWKCKRCRAKSH